MEFQVPISIRPLANPIGYQHKILLIGSCFTEHIGDSLEELKFSVLQNPNGILFDPHSVCKSLNSYIQQKQYSEEDFFQLNEVWHSWNYHSRYSHTNLREAVRIVNESQQRAHEFLKTADWIIITLGSSFSYRLTSSSESSKVSHIGGDLERAGVANCHRAPAQWFHKHLMTIDEVVSGLDDSLQRLFQFNPKLNIIFTVSPVRHIRDGVVDNNRSKARLIESVHHLVSKWEKSYYFPAYELVIDVLRDYRFYDADLVHPNYMGTEFVLEKFAESCIEDKSLKVMEEVKSIVTARKHRAFQPETNAHRQFLKTQLEKAKELKQRHPFLDLSEEINYFNS
ncbi:MAG: GSCFA domain-containing protein [Bacteroidetes bacterium]|nr:MAG: GSCFA domain-containing protein [Bacteroidota bacterium]